MSAIIVGQKIPGLGGAGKALEKQFSKLVQGFPDIAGVHKYGTLNIWLHYPLRIYSPDFTSQEIEWEEDLKETFSLTKVELQKYGEQQKYDAWIYVAHGSPHRGNALMIEILTQTLDIKDDDQVLIYLPKYRYSSCIIL
jgi:hypothetical protein